MKIHASIEVFRISDYAMTNIFFFESLFLMGFVPASNLGIDSGMLCIRWSNRIYLDRNIGDANLKKFGYPNLFSG